MRILLYTVLLRQYGVTYLDSFTDCNNRAIIYGYNTVTGQYSFWAVVDMFKLRLVEICESKTKALFSYRILSKGV